jgi:hypothetical protein
MDKPAFPEYGGWGYRYLYRKFGKQRGLGLSIPGWGKQAEPSKIFQ